jgi:hypothetical protein
LKVEKRSVPSGTDFFDGFNGKRVLRDTGCIEFPHARARGVAFLTFREPFTGQ